MKRQYQIEQQRAVQQFRRIATEQVTPVRFVRACRRGHLGDIDWPAFVHGQNPPCGRELYFDERGTSGDLGETYIRCGCGQERPMSQAADPNSRALGDCDGGRPWLGQGRVADERCSERNRLLIRAASNAWLPQPQRVISLPERDEKIRQTVDKLWMFLEAAESAEDLAYERRKPKVNEGLEGLTNEEVWEVVRERKNPMDSAEKPVKRAEIDTLLAPGDPSELTVPPLNSATISRLPWALANSNRSWLHSVIAIGRSLSHPNMS